MSQGGAILLFGKLKDAFGADRIDLPEGAGTAGAMRRLLAERHPDLAEVISAPSVRIAVNQELIVDEEDALLNAGDEIALLPPLSGG